MRRTTIAVLSACAVGLAAAVAAPVLWLQVDEMAVPPAAELAPLPAGVTVVADEVQCASGGCWRELTVDGSEGGSEAELAAGVGAALGLPTGIDGEPGESCHARSWLDLRRVCTGVGVRRGDVYVYLQYERLL
ncbi:hypothetical protein [Desertihabitans brevis]|nr:hypothetical protein [Desertihabitans brevis]